MINMEIGKLTNETLQKILFDVREQ